MSVYGNEAGMPIAYYQLPFNANAGMAFSTSMVNPTETSQQTVSDNNN